MQIVERHFDSYFIHAPFACFFTKQKGTQGVPFFVLCKEARTRRGNGVE